MNSRTTTEQQTLSEYNRARTLQYLHHHGIASRAQIAKALHLTPAALSKISNHLLASGAIVETGALEGKGNRIRGSFLTDLQKDGEKAIDAVGVNSSLGRQKLYPVKSAV